MKNILSFLCGGILLLLLFQSKAAAAPVGLDWFTNSGTGTGVFQLGAFYIDGVKYSGHQVGDINSDFFQRYVVRIGGSGAAPNAAQFGEGNDASHSGGQPGGHFGGFDNRDEQCAVIAPGSDSVCVSDARGNGNGGNLGLGFDPLGITSKYLGGRITVDDSGNGTNDPTTAVVQTIVKDSEFNQEFLKDSLNYKPKITATLTTPDMVSTVSMDMRAIDFNTMNVSTPFVNTLTFTDPLETYGNFNLATDAQNSNVTAGQFVYLPQGGWVSGFNSSTRIDFRAGIYLFPDGGGFNMFDNDVYGFYYNPDQNGGIVIPVPNNQSSFTLPPEWVACAAAGTCVLPAFAQD